jgi:hypothetical protein
MEHFRFSVTLTIVLVLAFVFAGCAKPPDAERSAAQAAMDAAVSAGADKYTAYFAAAKGRWAAAESLMKEKKYKEAKQSYLDAKSTFETATGGVEAGKKAITDEVNTALASLEDDWKNVAAIAKKAVKSMKDKKEDWVTDGKTFAAGLKAAKDMIATDPVSAKVKAGELKTLVDKWDTTLKELVTAPEKTEVPAKK